MLGTKTCIEKMDICRRRNSGYLGVMWIGMIVMSMFFFMLFFQSTAVSGRQIPRNETEPNSAYNAVKLVREHRKVLIENGLVRVTLSLDGQVTAIQHGGIENVLESDLHQDERGYWDIVYTLPRFSGKFQRIKGRKFKVIKNDATQIELSFSSSYRGAEGIPLNIDKRYVLLQGVSGFYTYAIVERLKGWPALNIGQLRIVYKLQKDKFRYMALSDDRQRFMPTAKDREHGRELEYPEAVIYKNSSHPTKREVDDKYQYSCDDKDNRVHGWISFDPPVGFWMITPSNEFRSAGPMKQDLTSHAGPVTLSMFMSNHYAGKDVDTWFKRGEPWKKVFGPVFVYLNSVPKNQNPLGLWNDAKRQMLREVQSWPYDFPFSNDFPSAKQRGSVSGRLLVHDRYINMSNIPASNAHLGLALPGEIGSWQKETKGYQFWVQTNNTGDFSIKNVRPGNYNLYGWIRGFIGDYRYNITITIRPGSVINLGSIIYEPPRNGPTLWEIGIPDRTATEFFIPSPNPIYTNQLYIHEKEKFRQYGLWERYTDLYRDRDLTYTIGSSNYRTDWFFAHVTRKTGQKTYKATTWKILFGLKHYNRKGTYRLRIALASANESELQVRINNPSSKQPYFSTTLIGRDNAIARHGIHGMYWLYSISIPASMLFKSNNTIYLTQSRSTGPFQGIMYDYIRLEGPA